jgi:hypothetical protein
LKYYSGDVSTKKPSIRQIDAGGIPYVNPRLTPFRGNKKIMRWIIPA